MGLGLFCGFLARRWARGRLARPLVIVLALSFHGSLTHAAGTPALPLMFGAFTSASLQQPTQGVAELTAMNNWLAANGASGVTLAGDFMSLTLNPAWNVPAELNAAWSAGFIPFVNLMLSESWESAYGTYDPNCATAANIAAGLCDQKIAQWADAFKAWATGGRKAYIAPMPEMNSDWVSYATGNSPAAFANAYKRIQSKFAERGVSKSTLRWVFAPNGWSDPDKPWQAFENYYPGDANVDIVGFSAYNYGGCPAASSWRIWDAFETAMAPYLNRMRLMASTKPIFIAQTGTVNVPNDPANAGTTENMSAWMRDTLGKLAGYPAVRAVIYFNKAKQESTLVNCASGADYRIFASGSGNTGFLDAMRDTRIGKWFVTDSRWDTIAFVDSATLFDDVRGAHPFTGEPSPFYFNAVNIIRNRGVTTGCSASPPLYCPGDATTRAQMAIFLLRAMHGGTYQPPAGSGVIFSDVPGTHWAAAWINQFAVEGMTSGCDGVRYCPDDAVTRDQMAKFLLRAKHGPSYTPPAVGGSSGFSDVVPTHWAAPWIKQLAVEGITTGCGGGMFCPGRSVSRAEMAVFIARAFGWLN